MAMYGRHGESPLPIVAAYSPAHCFDAAIEAARIALKYRTPVILLSDGYLANGAEPWLLPDVDDAARHLRRRSPPSRTTPTPTATRSSGPTSAIPRRWPGRGPCPARPASMHRIGGIEKEDGSGNISYDPDEPRAHGRTCGPPRSPASPTTSRRVEVDGRRRRRRDPGPRLGLDLGRHQRRRRPGAAPAAAGSPRPTSMHLNPFPSNLGEVLRRYPKVLVPEMNLGQLSQAAAGRVPGRRPVGDQGQGVPFTAGELERAILEELSMTDTTMPVTTRKDWSSDQEVRWCPGCGDYSILAAVQLLMPELGVRRENTVFVSGIGCAARFPYYMNTYGMHAHPRPGAGHRHRPGHGPPRPRRVGRRRRRRHAVDRRQPPDPRAAPQRQPHDPDVQQPDLRADQGPVLADQRGRQGHQVDAVRLARPRRSTRSALALGAEATLRGPHPRHGPQAHDGDVPPGPRPQGRGVRRDLPELQRLQRRRVRGDHGQGRTATTC